MKKQYVVIGLGRFGSSIARTLVEQDAEVLVIDHNEEKINQASSYATHAIQMDATDESALKSLGIRNFDVAFICIGEVQASIMITLLCKEHGIDLVLGKAGSELHAKVLYKMGADKVVFPERDTGIRIAHSILSSSILDFIELSPEYGIAEFEVYDNWIGKSILELDFRKKYGLNIIAIRHANDNINVNPMANDVLSTDDAIVVIGSEDQIGHLEKVTQKR